MSKEKLSVTISSDLVAFMNFYRDAHNEHNRSHIVQTALELLRQRELGMAYKDANAEIDDAFDACSGDGFDDQR